MDGNICPPGPNPFACLSLSFEVGLGSNLSNSNGLFIIEYPPTLPNNPLGGAFVFDSLTSANGWLNTWNIPYFIQTGATAKQTWPEVILKNKITVDNPPGSQLLPDVDGGKMEYHFDLNDGIDIIDLSGQSASVQSTIKFGAGISLADIHVTKCNATTYCIVYQNGVSYVSLTGSYGNPSKQLAGFYIGNTYYSLTGSPPAAYQYPP